MRATRRVRPAGAAAGRTLVPRRVCSMLLLRPRLVGRAKRLRVPATLRVLDLAPRHLPLLAYLQYDGPLTVNQLADRLEVAPTTVSLMVGDLSRLSDHFQCSGRVRGRGPSITVLGNCAWRTFASPIGMAASQIP